jgi:hypothetical protein
MRSLAGKRDTVRYIRRTVPPRKPAEFDTGPKRETGASALERALKGETAASLGRLGRAVEAMLAELRAASATDREAREYACAEAVWLYFVQREACGLVQHDAVIETYGIPSSVLSKVGAKRPSPKE